MLIIVHDIHALEEAGRSNREQVLVLRKRIESIVKGDASLQQIDQYRVTIVNLAIIDVSKL